MSGVCPTCGAVADEFVDLVAFHECNECGTRLDDASVVLESEARELIEEWRAAARDARDAGRVGDAQVLGSCADGLEALLK